MNHSKPNPTGPAKWLTLNAAAEHLSINPDALRRQFERHAIRTKDGGTEAHIDGVRARKFANRWRVFFCKFWTN